MTKNTPRLETWQIFHVARKTLGPATVANIFGRRNARSAYDWAQDPACTEVRVKRDPLEALHLLFSRLAEIGRADVARAAISYLKTSLGDNQQDLSIEIHGLQPTMDKEILKDFEAVGKLQQAITQMMPSVVIKALCMEAKAEIDRTLAKYLLDEGVKGE